MTNLPEPPAPNGNKWVNVAYGVVYRIIAALFAGCAVLLVGFAVLEVVAGLTVDGADLSSRFSTVLEAIGMLTISVAALELSQTVWEEEVLRKALMSAPTRVRRFISRFLVVVVVALAIEALVGAFHYVHDDPEQLPNAAAIAIGAAALLIAWGVFVRLNLSAETLEPEAMARAKREDRMIDEEHAAESEHAVAHDAHGAVHGAHAPAPGQPVPAQGQPVPAQGQPVPAQGAPAPAPGAPAPAPAAPPAAGPPPRGEPPIPPKGPRS